MRQEEKNYWVTLIATVYMICVYTAVIALTGFNIILIVAVCGVSFVFYLHLDSMIKIMILEAGSEKVKEGVKNGKVSLHQL